MEARVDLVIPHPNGNKISICYYLPRCLCFMFALLQFIMFAVMLVFFGVNSVTMINGPDSTAGSITLYIIYILIFGIGSISNLYLVKSILLNKTKHLKVWAQVVGLLICWMVFKAIQAAWKLRNGKTTDFRDHQETRETITLIFNSCLSVFYAIGYWTIKVLIKQIENENNFYRQWHRHRQVRVNQRRVTCNNTRKNDVEMLQPEVNLNTMNLEQSNPPSYYEAVSEQTAV